MQPTTCSDIFRLSWDRGEGVMYAFTYQNMLSVKRYSYVLPCTGHIKYVILIIAQQLIARRYVSISSI